MPADKYSAVWVSHSSIGDFLKCPRGYFLSNVYKDPKSGHKIMLMQPPLALGQAVHEAIESISTLPVGDRFKESLLHKFHRAWEKVSGDFGGFKSMKEENVYKQRGIDMIKRVINNPGPILRKAIKIKEDLPYYYLSEEENIILCGKIDWLEYMPDDNSVHIIDFKTGKHDEKENSLQLPIYCLLVKNCQNRKISKASYWYLDREDTPIEVMLPDLEDAYDRVFSIAIEIKKARAEISFPCPRNGCFACKPLEAILRGEGRFVGESDYRQDVYILN